MKRLIRITYRGWPVVGVIRLPFFWSCDGRGCSTGLPVICAFDWRVCALVGQLNVKKDGATVSTDEGKHFVAEFGLFNGHGER